jgi:hypothetical protein
VYTDVLTAAAGLFVQGRQDDGSRFGDPQTACGAHALG